jgi:hypothetical protein
MIDIYIYIYNLVINIHVTKIHEQLRPGSNVKICFWIIIIIIIIVIIIIVIIYWILIKFEL